jgi:hypothetical protein
MPPKSIGYIKEPVEIRIDVEALKHVAQRQYRHGPEYKITDDQIIETIEKATEELTIALMQDKFDICQKQDNYPTKGIKKGEPNRFVIRNKENDLNLVCQLKAGEWEFTLTVVTVMIKHDFKAYHGQFIIEV